MNQKEIEALYSQRQIHTVFHEAIRFQLDRLLLNWSILAYMQLDIYLEGEYHDSKKARVKELQAQIDAHGLENIVVAIAAAVLHTHTTQNIQQATGYLQAFLSHENAFARAITAAELLAVCSKKGSLFEIERQGSGKPALIKVNHWKHIDKVFSDSFKWVNNTCFNPPLVEPPLEVTSNHRCGYHTLKEPLLLGKLTLHDEPQNLQAINILNEIEWVLDQDVLAEAETPSKPLETPLQHQNFSKMVQESNFIYRMLGNDPFWLAWQYDSRGRIYSHGYHVNLQAAEYKKASLSFNKYEELT